MLLQGAADSTMVSGSWSENMLRFTNTLYVCKLQIQSFGLFLINDACFKPNLSEYELFYSNCAASVDAGINQIHPAQLSLMSDHHHMAPGSAVTSPCIPGESAHLVACDAPRPLGPSRLTPIHRER